MTLDNALDDLYGDGFTVDSVRQAAAAVTELVRYLNHATLATNVDVTLPYPYAVADVVMDLHQAVQRLPQTLRQLSDRLDQIADDTESVSSAMADAISCAQAMTYDLAAAARHANQIPARTPIAG